MPKMVCGNCEIELKPETNGVLVIETMNGMKPYKLWRSDLWKCPSCATEIVAGFAMEPIAEHFEKGFEQTMRREIANAPITFYDRKKPK